MAVLSEGRARWTLDRAVPLVRATFPGCVVLLLLALAATPLATEAKAATGTGQITGTVTKAEGGTGLEGIEVCAYTAGGELEKPPCTTTAASGEYTIPELQSGEYYVEFAVPQGSPLYYITQYYDDKSSFSEAQPVSVGTSATSKIDAEMQEGGDISGTVTEYTESEDIVPLQNIEVTAYQIGENKLSTEHTTTNENGEYTIVGLTPGSYKVEFAPTPESGLNFVTQYYKNKLSRVKAEAIEVIQGKTTEKINAAMRVGGEISGTVTDAWTHTPVPNVFVVATGMGGGFAGIAYTNASGEYTIVGLASGEYEVTFVDSPYILQYYNNQPSPAGAEPVPAEEGSATPGIDAALVRKEPVDTAAPAVSGTPAVGQTLSCSTGAWTGDPMPTYTYQWLRNGSAIAGASASSYGVQSADQGTGLACKVTATNEHGSTGAASNTLSVPAAPPPPASIPEVKLLSAKILVSRGSARVGIDCAKASCRGTVELTEQIVVRHSHHGRTRSRREMIVLGRGVYTLSAGHSATISIHLTKAGRKALARARHHRLPVTARVLVTGGTAIQEPVVLSEPVHRRKRKARAGSYSV